MPEVYARRGQREDLRRRSEIVHRRESAPLDQVARDQLSARTARRRELLASVESGTRQVGSGYWTEERCIQALHRFTTEQGRTPAVGDMLELRRTGRRAKKVWPSPSRVRLVFGSWNAALVVAGLPARTSGAKASSAWTDEALLEQVRAAVQAGEGSSGFRSGTRRPVLGVIVARFGSWNVARALAFGKVAPL